MNLTFTQNRRIEDEFWQEGEGDFPRGETMIERLDDITNEVRDIREGLRDSPIDEQSDFYGDNSNDDEYYGDNNEEDNDVEELKKDAVIKKAKKASSKHIQYEDPKLTKYKAFLMKLSQVNDYEDFKRTFKVREPVTFKRTNQIPMAPMNVPECDKQAPKLVTMPIDFTSSTHYIYPDCLEVKRCTNVGCCKLPNQECGAKTKIKKQVRVYKIDHSTQAVDFHTVSYEDDDVCGCTCKTKADDCKSPHVLDSTTCRCECPLKPKTDCGVNKQWSSFYCACVCTDKNPTCDPDEVWDISNCKCEKATPPTCPTATILDSKICRCR